MIPNLHIGIYTQVYAENLVDGPLKIGASLWAGGMSATGSLDDVRIYNRTLSSNEVSQLFLIESVPFLNVRKAVYLDSPNMKAGTNYQIQVSTDLTTWTNHGTSFTATTNTWRSTNYWDVDNWNQLFFRLQAVP